MKRLSPRKIPRRVGSALVCCRTPGRRLELRQGHVFAHPALRQGVVRQLVPKASLYTCATKPAAVKAILRANLRPVDTALPHWRAPERPSPGRRTRGRGTSRENQNAEKQVVAAHNQSTLDHRAPAVKALRACFHADPAQPGSRACNVIVLAVITSRARAASPLGKIGSRVPLQPEPYGLRYFDYALQLPVFSAF